LAPSWRIITSERKDFIGLDPPGKKFFTMREDYLLKKLVVNVSSLLGVINSLSRPMKLKAGKNHVVIFVKLQALKSPTMIFLWPA